MHKKRWILVGVIITIIAIYYFLFGIPGGKVWITYKCNQYLKEFYNIPMSVENVEYNNIYRRYIVTVTTKETDISFNAVYIQNGQWLDDYFVHYWGKAIENELKDKLRNKKIQITRLCIVPAIKTEFGKPQPAYKICKRYTEETLPYWREARELLASTDIANYNDYPILMNLEVEGENLAQYEIEQTFDIISELPIIFNQVEAHINNQYIRYEYEQLKKQK